MDTVNVGVGVANIKGDSYILRQMHLFSHMYTSQGSGYSAGSLQISFRDELGFNR